MIRFRTGLIRIMRLNCFIIIPFSISFAVDINLNIITADSLFDLGQYQTAESLYRQTIHSAGDREKGWPLKGLGNIAFVFGQMDSAEHYYREALVWFEKTDELRGQARVWINLGSVAFQRNRFIEARQCWEKALALIDRSGAPNETDQRDRISALANLGQVFRQAGAYSRADSLFSAGLAFSEAIRYPRGVADNYYNLGDLARLKGEVDQALDYYAQAAQRYQQLGHYKLSADVLRETAAVYRRLGDFDKAYAALFQALAFLRLAKRDRSFISGEAELLNRLGLLHQEIGNLRLARENFHKAQSIYQALADSAGIKDALMNLGSVFLKMAADDPVCLDSSQDYFQRALALVRTDRERAAIFNNLGVQSELRGDHRAAEKNYGQALKIYRRQKETTGLAQVFNNLGNLAVAAGYYRSAIDHYEEAWRLIAGRHQAGLGSFPVGQSRPRLSPSRLYCSGRQQSQRQHTDNRRSPAFGDPDGSLAAARAEVDNIAAVIPENKILILGQATENRVKTLPSGYSILHLATHARLDPVNPRASCIIFASDSAAVDDGRLEFGEILRLPLKTRTSLVTLSACQTSIGRNPTGGEVMSLARAFTAAGTPSILSTLWPVEDQATRRLMVTFYRGLREVDKASALRRAQLDLLSDPRTAHPFFWAPFILIGERN